MAVDYYLDIPGFEGEAKDAAHKGKIYVYSFQWSAKQHSAMGRTGGGTSGKIEISDFTFTLETCKGTPKMMEACALGKTIPEANLYCRKSTTGGMQDYLTWKFKNVIISSYNMHADASAEIPIDTASFNYGSVELKYKAKDDASGNLVPTGGFGWSLEENRQI